MRVKRHERGRSAVSPCADGLMRRGGSAQTASRRICGSAIGPWHLYTHPGSGLHASGGVGAELTFNPVVEILMR